MSGIPKESRNALAGYYRGVTRGANGMPIVTAAHAAVLDLLGLLAAVRDRVDRAPVRRGKPARLAV